MTEFTIDTDEANEDLAQAVADASTQELIDIYRHLESKTLFQHVADELDHRERHRGGMLHDDQRSEIAELLGK